MRRVFYTLVIFFVIALLQSHVYGQVLDPNDPDNIFTAANHPPTPAYGSIAKWGHSKVVNWNSFDSGYKSYYYNGMAFRLKFPKTYQPGVNDGKSYPCYIFLHGAGEKGDLYNNDYQLLHGGQTHAKHVNNGDFDGFLLYPQSPNEYLAGYLNNVLGILDYMVANVKLDRDRVIVGGLSSGGQGTWTYLTNAPQAWAAVTPISASIGIDINNIKNLLSVPAWLANGGQDKNPSPFNITAIVNKYNELGGDVKQSFYPSLGHGVWNNFWAEPGYFQYLSEADKTQPVVKFNRTEWCPDETIRSVMILQPGFYQYEWQKDGVTIPGEIKDSLVVTTTGTYQARFKRTSTSAWSKWSPRPIAITLKGATITPPITVNGLHSIVLPAPDGSQTVPLMVNPGFATYEWRNVSDNSLVSTTNTLDAPVGQYKVKVSEQYGCSSSFSDPFTVIKANGTNAPDKAIGVTAVTLSTTSVEVFWNNNPLPAYNETAFEVYRSTTPGANYSLVNIIPADSLLIIDKNLSPNTTYYYVVRAVNNTSAAPVSNEASVKTQTDVNPPTVPTMFKVAGTTRHSVSLSWNPSSDDVGVKFYEVYLDGTKAFTTPETNFVVNGLDSFTSVSFYIKAVDYFGNKSAPTPQVSAFTKRSGLQYSVYEGTWSQLPDFTSLTPVQTGTSPNVNISVSPVTTNYGIMWVGDIDVPATANWTFYIESDDGSAMYLDQEYGPGVTPFISNDGLHGTATQSKTINNLAAGKHKIILTFFQAGGGAVMNIYWKNNKILGGFYSKAKILDKYFADSETPSGSAPSKPTALSAAAPSFNLVNLNWTDNSNNENGFEVYRKATSESTYSMVGRTDADKGSYDDSTVAENTTYAYRVQAVNEMGASGFNPDVTIKTPKAPAIPDIPKLVTLEVLSPNIVNISFKDSSTQTGYEIYRSLGDDTQFRIFKTVNTTDSSVSIADSGLFANTAVYYKIRAFGISGLSDYSDIVTVTTTNSTPKITQLETKYIYFAGSSIIPVSASDADGDNLTFITRNLPGFAQFIPTENGKGNLVFNPVQANQGTYNIRVVVNDDFGGKDSTLLTLIVNNNRPPAFGRTRSLAVDEGASLLEQVSAVDPDRRSSVRYELVNAPDFVSGRDAGGTQRLLITPGYADAGSYSFTVIANDGAGGIDSTLINLTVNDVNPSAPKIFVNILNSGTTPAPSTPWNNITSATTSSLLFENGQSSTVGLTFSPANFNTSSLGTNTGNNSGIYPDAVMRDNYYFGTVGIPDTIYFILDGLVPNSDYRLTTFSASSYSEGTTVFKSNEQIKSIDAFNNTSNKAVFSKLMSDEDGKISVKMYKSLGTAIGYLNAIILEKPYDDGTTPANPANFVAVPLPNGSVMLKWRNVAYNADGYSVLRAIDSEGEYLPVNGNETGGNDSAYVDNSVNGNQQYYYKLVGFNDYGHSDTVGIAQVLTLNKIPVIQPVSDVFLKAGNSEYINIIGTDDATELLMLKVTGLPSFATFQSSGNGTGIIDIQSMPGDEGTYGNIKITLTDPFGAVATTSFSISISDNQVRSAFINFTDGANAEALPWNNFQAPPNPYTTMSGIKDDMNSNTPFTFKFTTVLGGYSLQGMTDANEGVFSDKVLRTGIYVNNNSNNVMQFAGLNTNKRYNVVFTSSYNSGDIDSATFTSGGKTIGVNGRYNTNKTAQLNGLTPDGSGIIEISFVKSAATPYFMLNAIKLEEYDDGVILNPANLVAEPTVSNKSIRLIWSDRSDSETGYEIWRSTSPGGTYSLINTTAANITSYIDNSPGLVAGNIYYYKVRTRKNVSFSEYSNTARFALAKSLVLLNLNTLSVNNEPAPWNNTDDVTSGEGFTLSALQNTDYFNSGINFVITKEFNGQGFAGVSVPGVLPYNVMFTDIWTDAGQVSEVKFTGLDLRKTYRIGVFNSIDKPNYYVGVYTINGVSKAINGYINNSKMIYFDNIRPDENGEIYVSVTPDATSSYCFTNAFTIESYTNTGDETSGNGFMNSGNLVQTSVIPMTDAVSVTREEALNGIKVLKLSAYPNPFVKELTAEIDLPANSSQVVIEMYDLNSRLIFKKEVANAGSLGGKKTVSLPVKADLAPGVYMLKLSANGTSKTLKLVKGN